MGFPVLPTKSQQRQEEILGLVIFRCSQVKLGVGEAQRWDMCLAGNTNPLAQDTHSGLRNQSSTQVLLTVFIIELSHTYSSIHQCSVEFTTYVHMNIFGKPPFRWRILPHPRRLPFALLESKPSPTLDEGSYFVFLVFWELKKKMNTCWILSSIFFRTYWHYYMVFSFILLMWWHIVLDF